MNILVIHRDKSVFTQHGPGHAELLACSALVDQLHVIVVTDKKDNLQGVVKLTDKLFLYPTNSSSPLLYIWDIYKTAKFQLTSKFDSIVDLVTTADNYVCAIATYLFCKRFEINYIVNVYNNGLSASLKDGVFTASAKTSLSNFLFKKAAGVRVPSQADGEMIFDQNPLLEKKIYILPYPTDLEVKKQKAQIESSVDIHKNYPQFNIIFLMADQSSDMKTLKRAKNIMEYLHSRYPRSGLVILGAIEKKPWHFLFFNSLPDYIVFENNTSNKIQYARTANVFIDTSDHHTSGGALTEAGLAGCPIVASDTEASRAIIKEGENGFIVDSNKTEAFVYKVIEVLERRGFRERMKLLAKYDITEVYGEKVEDYQTRLVDIWAKNASSHGNKKLVANVVTPITKTYPAFTMDVAKKVQERLMKQKMVIPQRSDTEVMNVDIIQTGIQEALSEIDLTEKDPKNIASKGLVNDVEKVEDVDKF